jgi:uncharacterized membrane protein YeaQ/YmgE (transglycosylase-associated protein family)
MPYWLMELIIGALAGWIAGRLMRGSGFGILGDIIVGIIGAFIGGWVFGLLGITAYSFIGRLIVAIIGAVILIWIVRAIKRA